MAMIGFAVALPLACVLVSVVASKKAAHGGRWVLLVLVAAAVLIAWLTQAAQGI